MRFSAIRRVFAALLAVLVLNTAWAPFVLAATHAQPAMAQMADSDCMKMAMAHHEHGSKMPMPCDCSNLACLLQMGCLGVGVGLLPTTQFSEAFVGYERVSYVSASFRGSGFEPSPEPLPPRSLSL